MKRLLNHLTTLGIITILLLTPLTAVGTASAEPLGTVTRYSTPTLSAKPYDMVVGPDNNMWFTENGKAKIGRMTALGAITEFSLPTGYREPRHITSGPNGSVWFTARGGAAFYAVGEITMGGLIAMHDLPHELDRNPNLGATYSVPNELVNGGGYLWLIWQGSRYMAKIDISGQVVEQIEMSAPRGYDGVPEGANTSDIRSRDSYQAVRATYDSYAGDGIWVAMYGGVISPQDTFIEKISFDGSRTRVLTAPEPIMSFGAMVIDSQGTFWFGADCCNYDLKYVTRSGQAGYVDIGPTGGTHFALTLTVGPDGALWAGIETAGIHAGTSKIIRVDPVTHAVAGWSIGTGEVIRPQGLTIGPDLNAWFVENTTSKVSRIGTGLLPSNDSDGDGLSLSDEFTQGTLDTDTDMDNDGLSDYIESAQFVGRSTTFCNQSTSYCEYPHPLHKDLYVEVDWMVEPGVGGLNMKPTSGHIAQLEIAYADQGIRPHFDTGQFGGGNEAPYYSNVNFEPDMGDDHDFYDFKNGNSVLSAQFDSASRYGIWRYMLMAPKIQNNVNYGGVSYGGDDDSLLAYESMLGHGPDFDQYFPRTMLHELGHNLCLTNSTAYTGQDASCVFEGVDQQGYSLDYASAMNYSRTLTTDYSHGSNPEHDHDDWTAVQQHGFDDFVQQEVGDTVAHSYSAAGKKIKKDPGRILKNPKAKQQKNAGGDIYRKPLYN